MVCLSTCCFTSTYVELEYIHAPHHLSVACKQHEMKQRSRLTCLALFGGNPELPIAQHLPDFLPNILPGTAQQSQWGLKATQTVLQPSPAKLHHVHYVQTLSSHATAVLASAVP